MQGVKAPCFERGLRIAADIAMLPRAREWAAEAAADFGLSEEACFAVKLATSEGVSNAIIHGSASAEDPVELGASEEDGALVFEVRDHASKAPGYLVDRVTEGGRGLELVALVTDETQLTRTDSGSVLRFVKRP